VGVLTSMKRGSSGISHEQATETSYQGIVDEQDRIPFQRSRDKGHLERYYVTPSVPKAVIAKEILEILEPKFRLGQTSASLDTFLLKLQRLPMKNGSGGHYLPNARVSSSALRTKS
jgi:hypothetical protein